MQSVRRKQVVKRVQTLHVAPALPAVQLALAALLLPAPMPATAAPPAAAATVPGQPPLSEISSCAGSGPAIQLAPADSRALLDAADRDMVQAAVVARYPLLQRDGFAAPYMLLWRAGGGD